MKKLLFFFFLVPVTLTAQTYVPFISTTDSSDTWLDVNSCTDLNCYHTYTNRYTIEGDTMIGGLQYMKIYCKTKHEQGSDQSQWCTVSTTYSEYYFGAMRESGKKIYVIPDLFNPVEYVAYDFNLSVGDTLPSPASLPSDPSGRIISSIDSVQVFGAYRKRYLINSSKYVIEGIGASTGLFNPIVYNTSYCDMQMLCYAEYGTPDYFLSNCGMNLSVSSLDVDQGPAQLVKIVDALGRETVFKPNTPLIYLYSDGTTKKVYTIE